MSTKRNVWYYGVLRIRVKKNTRYFWEWSITCNQLRFYTMTFRFFLLCKLSLSRFYFNTFSWIIWNFRYVFDCNKWFDYDSGVDHVLTAIPYDEFRSYKDMIVYTVAENHLWISLVFRPLKSNFTRIQRLSCILGLIHLIMVLCTISLEAKSSENTSSKEIIGPFRFSMEGFKMSLMAVFIASIIISIVSFFLNMQKAIARRRLLTLLLEKYIGN